MVVYQQVLCMIRSRYSSGFNPSTASRRHAQRGAEGLSRSARVHACDPVKPAVRLAVGDRVEHRTTDEPTDLVGIRLHQLDAVAVQHGSIATSNGNHSFGAPSAWIVP